MTEYERQKIDADTVRELLRGLRGPWFLKWDEPTSILSAQCCNCGLRVSVQVRNNTLARVLTSKLAHKC